MSDFYLISEEQKIQGMEAGKEKTALELLCITSVCRGQGWAGLFCGSCRDHKVVRANTAWSVRAYWSNFIQEDSLGGDTSETSWLWASSF